MTTATPLRIGEVAERRSAPPRARSATTRRSGCSGGGEREAGRHRTYEEADVERLRDALRFKQLLGLSLDELKALLEAEEAAPRSAPSGARATPAPAAGARSSSRRSATSTASSSWSAAAGRTSTRSKRSWPRSGPKAKRKLREL